MGAFSRLARISCACHRMVPARLCLACARIGCLPATMPSSAHRLPLPAWHSAIYSCLRLVGTILYLDCLPTYASCCCLGLFALYCLPLDYATCLVPGFCLPGFLPLSADSAIAPAARILTGCRLGPVPAARGACCCKRLPAAWLPIWISGFSASAGSPHCAAGTPWLPRQHLGLLLAKAMYAFHGC